MRPRTHVNVPDFSITYSENPFTGNNLSFKTDIKKNHSKIMWFGRFSTYAMAFFVFSYKNFTSTDECMFKILVMC